MDKTLRRRWTQVVFVAVIMYTISFIDRMNVAVALPHMSKDLHLSATAAGVTAGIFFIGYFLFQVPAGKWAVRFGSKRFISVLLVLWGIFAILSGFSQNATQLYITRLLLGLAEGGIWPATLVLLSNWFLAEERARASAIWMLCLPLGGAISGPLSGVLISHLGWRWMFILEGIPALVWVIPWWFLIEDSPEKVSWLSIDAKNYLGSRLHLEEEARRQRVSNLGWRSWAFHPTVIMLSLVYILSIIGGYGVLLWLPSIMGELSGKGIQWVGFISAIPYVVAMIAMVLFGYLADKTQKHIRFVVLSLVLAAVSMFITSFTGTHAWFITIILLSISVAGFFGRQGPLWAIPSTMLPKELAGPAMGFINAFGNLGGFIGPTLFGAFLGATHNFVRGYLVLSVCMILAAILMATLVTFSRKGVSAFEDYRI